jgi:hypothetical protein
MGSRISQFTSGVRRPLPSLDYDVRMDPHVIPPRYHDRYLRLDSDSETTEFISSAQMRYKCLFALSVCSPFLLCCVNLKWANEQYVIR